MSRTRHFVGTLALVAVALSPAGAQSASPASNSTRAATLARMTQRRLDLLTDGLTIEPAKRRELEAIGQDYTQRQEAVRARGGEPARVGEEVAALSREEMRAWRQTLAPEQRTAFSRNAVRSRTTARKKKA